MRTFVSGNLDRRDAGWKPFSLAVFLTVPQLALANPAAIRDQSEPALHGPLAPVPPEVVTRDPDGRIVLRAVRLDEPLNLDGELDEEVYSRVPAVSDFVQQEPREGEPASEQTEAWVFFDDKNLYVSARCWDSHPERMVANEMRRDSANIFENENFVVILDTFYDRRNGLSFQTNPLGALRDLASTDEGNSLNMDWNTVWDVKAARFSEGWTLEMEIPFKSLRYKLTPSQVWGINMRRMVRWKNENSFLSPVAASYQWRGVYQLSSAATLVGIEVPLQSRNLEVKPYAISSVVTDNDADPPYSNDGRADVGVDVKYGLTNSLIADFTYNTDFAQVEEDQLQVNLTRFSLFFPEKRDFFLEGQGIFAFGGVEWHGVFDQRPEDDNPSLTPILFFSRNIGLAEDGVVPIVAGGRVTGRAGKYRIGALNIQTEEAFSGTVPSTNHTVFRLRRDILRRSDIGIMGTYRSHSVEAPSGPNGVLGVDANFTFYENLKLSTYYARSETPDLLGGGDDDESYSGKLDYQGDRYGLKLEQLLVGKDFLPELGFLRREAFRRSYVMGRFSPRPQSIDAVRKFNWEASLDYITGPEGAVETRRVWGAFRTEFQKGDEAGLEFARDYEYLTEGFEVREGMVIPVGGYHFQGIRASYLFGPQRAVPGYVTFRRGSFYSGDRTELAVNARIELSSRFSIEPRVFINWVDIEEGAFTDEVVSTRVNFTFSPRMVVSSLIQYDSAGDSLSASARFRWEYQPGSDLFVVYSEGRDTERDGFPLLTDRTLAVKFTRLFRF